MDIPNIYAVNCCITLQQLKAFDPYFHILFHCPPTIWRAAGRELPYSPSLYLRKYIPSLFVFALCHSPHLFHLLLILLYTTDLPSSKAAGGEGPGPGRKAPKGRQGDPPRQALNREDANGMGTEYKIQLP